MPEPEVQQLHNVGPPVARWRVPTSFSFCTCPLYFAWVFLSYLMPSHFIGIFSLGPCILFYFFRCLTPPWQQTRVILVFRMAVLRGRRGTYGTLLVARFVAVGCP